MTSGADRAAFLDGYRSAVPDAEGWPHEPTLWVTRFVAALAVVPFAARVGDPDFAAHAVTMLDRLAAEIS